MKKLLYITDQEEYSQRGTIGPLFNKYLKEFLKINMVYVTKYKHSFQQKGDDFIFPQSKEKDIINYLIKKDVDIASYDYIFVRNKDNILEQIIKNKDKYNYKIGFRISYPKTIQTHRLMRLKEMINPIKAVICKYKEYKKRQLSNKCDIFMPSSYELKAQFYSNVKAPTFPIFAGLDPQKIHKHTILQSDIYKFIYIGTIDELREFDVILDAFAELPTKPWELTICCQSQEFISKLVDNYPEIKSKITLIRANNLDELDLLVTKCDINLATLPNKDIYNTTFPAKAFNGYASAIPAIVSKNSKNESIFDKNEAIFTNFDKKEIKNTILEVLAMSKSELNNLGSNGQDKLMKLDRNYEIMAKQLYNKLLSL